MAAITAGQGRVAASSGTSTVLQVPQNLVQTAHATPTVATIQPTKFDLWLDSLSWAESNDQAHIKHLDSDGNWAYGCLQFHMSTFKAYTKMYDLPQATTTAGWLDKIYDCSTQKQLAKAMIQDDYANWKHWKYTVLHKGIGLPPLESTLPAVAVAK
jgi:hypothetical protein